MTPWPTSLARLGVAAGLAAVEAAVATLGRRPDRLEALAASVRGRLRGAYRALDAAAGDLLERPPRGAWNAALGETLESILAGRVGELRRRELRNKLRVYRLVRGARARLGEPAGPLDLVAAAGRAYAGDPWEALWLLEGAGQDWAATEWAAARRPDLADPRFDVLPRSSLLALHCGLGLATAVDALGRLAPEASAEDVARSLEGFVDTCRATSRASHLGAVLESLGLVARVFFPELVPALVRGLDRRSDPALAGTFWHGLGRGLYFRPLAFAPGQVSAAAALRAAEREVPPGPPYDAAEAGVAYAAALVNLGEPDIIAEPFALGVEALRGRPYVTGILAALALRDDATPGDGIAALLAYRPADPRAAAAWRELVTDAAGSALDAARRAARESNPGAPWLSHLTARLTEGER